MELILNNILIPIECDGNIEYQKAAALKLGVTETEISISKLISKTLEMKNRAQFHYNLSLVVRVDGRYPNRQKFSLYAEAQEPPYKAASCTDRPIIVGFGPAGMFAALEFIEAGIKPIIFERGQKIEVRSADVQRFIDERELDTESNIQFGEGGAGSYSDGKLFSRRNNNTSPVHRVLKTFIKFGAPANIEYIGKPHLGTDVLCTIVRNIRLHILEHGGEIHYGAKMTDILISSGAASGIVINGEKEYLSTNIYIALGHSARDTFEMMHNRGITIEQKPISVGVRIEHPVETINLIRYGEKYCNHPGLGAATYSLNYTNRKTRRGVYTFCNCPGGEVVNASSEQGMHVVNGMSYSHRSSPFSNAAMIATCKTTDYESEGFGSSPLAGIEFQKEIERKAFTMGGGTWSVPAQNLMNFLGESTSTNLNDNSFKMGAIAADMHDIFPGFIIEELKAAFDTWREEVPLFVSEQAILLGAETRASTPIRIVRNDNFESTNTRNLYPIGEGAGYAGGITSSAADAVKAVQLHLFQR